MALPLQPLFKSRVDANALQAVFQYADNVADLLVPSFIGVEASRQSPQSSDREDSVELALVSDSASVSAEDHPLAFCRQLDAMDAITSDVAVAYQTRIDDILTTLERVSIRTGEDENPFVALH